MAVTTLTTPVRGTSLHAPVVAYHPGEPTRRRVRLLVGYTNRTTGCRCRGSYTRSPAASRRQLRRSYVGTGSSFDERFKQAHVSAPLGMPLHAHHEILAG